MKVKHLIGIPGFPLEKLINEFLGGLNGNVYDIKYQHAMTEDQYEIPVDRCSALIFYENFEE